MSGYVPAEQHVPKRDMAIATIGVTDMASATTQPVAARVPNEHAQQIAELARYDGSTISAVLARIIAAQLNDDHRTDDEDEQ
jgi:hypothetical protein